MNLGDLATLRFHRRYDEEVVIALSALDCVLLSRKGVYASSELTSGRRAQRLQREHNVRDPVALRESLGAERYNTLVWSPNVESALAFAEGLRSRIGAQELVVSPAPLVAPDWPQPAYLEFWNQVIRSRVKAVYFNDGWQFSNGCVHEFVVASQERLPTLDRDGQAISDTRAIEMIVGAVRELESTGLETRLIQTSLELLVQAVSR